MVDMVVVALQHGLELMSVIAVMVNCALIGMSDLADRLFPGWGTAERIVFIVALEVIVISVLITGRVIIEGYWICAYTIELHTHS